MQPIRLVMGRWLLLCLLALVATFAGAAAAPAAVPGEINYQGLLLDDLGQPVTGSVDMEFRLYDADTAGTLLWTETHPGVPVADGIYDVALGATTPISASVVAGGAIYLQVSVDGEVMTPRQRLLVVPYALRAEVAETAESIQGQSGDFFTQMLQHYEFDGNSIGNLDPREGLGDADGDGVANFLDADNDGDGLSDQVEVGAGSDMNLPTPIVTSFSPATADGFTPSVVTVNGSSFSSGLTVSFGSQSPTPTGLTSTSFTVDLGPEPPGPAPVTVTLANGETATSSYDFFYYQPTITSVVPNVLPENVPGSFDLTGENFILGMTVQVGAESAALSNLTATSVTVDVSSLHVRAEDITVTLPNGEFSTATGGIFFGGPKRLFVSTLRYDGNLGGLAGADALCSQLAQDGSLGGSFQVWLGDATNGPADRTFRQGRPYVSTTGAVVADDWADLTDGTLDSAPNRDQYGNPVASSYYVWTNVSAVGGGTEGAADCNGWTSAAPGGSGAYGVTGATSATWTDSVTTQCSALNHVYCIEE